MTNFFNKKLIFSKTRVAGFFIISCETLFNPNKYYKVLLIIKLDCIETQKSKIKLHRY